MMFLISMSDRNKSHVCDFFYYGFSQLSTFFVLNRKPSAMRVEDNMLYKNTRVKTCFRTEGPPVNNVFPCRVASSSPCGVLLPDTSVLKMTPPAIFQPMYRPIASHSLWVATYAAVSRPPASTAIASAPQSEAFGFARCISPNSRLVITSAIQVPVHSSNIRNKTPRT
ncbi:hypothetical protein SAMN05444392_111103 [Seinonella peptonophila]|uniref:Uncharacterized protein n=1 Tax=Seinonella peptonophila TaxID=112248 RepID=A0A1M5A1Z7_9BACL|nr:hypothetical protein SAMN05444392_111103 [Seinonella peptonophila]